MENYMMSLVLALFGQLLHISSPMLTTPSDIALYQLPTVMPLPATAETSRAYAHLQGAVRTVRVEVATPPDVIPALSRTPVQTMRFDDHGYLTEIALYRPNPDPHTLEAFAAFTYANVYDAQARLEGVNLTGRIDGAPMPWALQRTHDSQGRLVAAQLTTSREPPSSEPFPTGEYAASFDTENRLHEQTVWVKTGDKLQRLFSTSYRYQPDGGVMVESEACEVGLTTRQWFDARGLLTELHQLNPKGQVEQKTFLHYNGQGDPLRISQWEDGQWERAECRDYVYDAQGNWTARRIDGGLRGFGMTVMQYRTLTYAE